MESEGEGERKRERAGIERLAHGNRLGTIDETQSFFMPANQLGRRGSSVAVAGSWTLS